MSIIVDVLRFLLKYLVSNRHIIVLRNLGFCGICRTVNLCVGVAASEYLINNSVISPIVGTDASARTVQLVVSESTTLRKWPVFCLKTYLMSKISIRKERNSTEVSDAVNDVEHSNLCFAGYRRFERGCTNESQQTSLTPLK